MGTWTNSPTAYTRQWRRGNPSSGGGEPTSYSNISGATSSTYTTTSSDDGKYIICRITATNAVGSNTVSSNSIYVNKYAPDAFGTYSVSGGLLVGSTLTATAQIGTWKVTTDNTDDTYPDTFIYEWSDTNGNILHATSSDTYLIASGDLNKTLRLRVQGTNTGGDAYTEYQNLGTVTSVYRFAFGNNLYVSSNGHIGLDSGSSSYTSMSAGRNIAVFVEDFQQYYLAEYSNSSVYYLYIKGYLYDSSASSVNALDYQIKFYNDPSINYCDIYIVRKGSNVAALSDIDPGYYSSGTNGYAGMVGPYFIGAGTVFRVYFGDQAGTTSGIPWTAVNDNLWDVIQTWTGQGAGGLGIDDTFTTVTSAPNQQAPILTAPTITSVSVSNQGGPVSVNFTGGSGPFYQAYWTGGVAPTVPVTPDASGSASPLTDSTGPSSSSTFYMYVRSVLTQSETSVGPSPVASAWSSGVAFNMISTDLTQNTAPTARATNTFSTSTVKYLDSITWSSGTYTNASSISSVLLYSTNTSNLVAPGGNTSSAFRTANPYTLSTVDPSPPAYVFAVRDTVVGINGTTYYFYSNQIVSALADAVAFSYGSATSSTGGWTASINSGSQAGATYSYISATVGSGSVNSSTGAVTASGLSSNQSSTITVQKAVYGYNTALTTVSGTAATVVTYTLSYSANGGSTTPSSQTGTQGTSITLAANAGTRSGFTFGGWNIGGATYSGYGSYTFGSANATATAIWNAVFVEPTTSAPALQFRRLTGPQYLRWYCDYPSVSNGTIIGMGWQLSTTESTAGLLNSGTRAYPGAFTYPYNVSGVGWAFKAGVDGQVSDISYSSSARFGRARVVMQGTNGLTYYGAWSSWI